MRSARLLWTAAAVITATLSAAAAPEPEVSVRESGGIFSVSATFVVAQPADVVRAVLTDYDGIPRFMPGVESSRVLRRTGDVVHVEQQAVSKYMMFSKRVHLVLEVEEGVAVIRFRDQCNRSFAIYQGSWTFTSGPRGTEIHYALTAKPEFGVPGFVLRKVLDRDARVMIDGLRAEIAARAVTL